MKRPSSRVRQRELWNCAGTRARRLPLRGVACCLTGVVPGEHRSRGRAWAYPCPSPTPGPGETEGHPLCGRAPEESASRWCFCFGNVGLCRKKPDARPTEADNIQPTEARQPGGTVLSRAGHGGACRGVRRRREVRRLSKNEPRPARHGQTSASGGTSSSIAAFASIPASAFSHGPRVLAAGRLFIFLSVGRVFFRTL